MTERKKEIVAIASSLFRQKGYTVVSMRLLAEAVGMKAASLYNHISSKQEILSIIILGVAQRFTDGMAQINSRKNTPIEKLREIMLLHIEITLDDPEGMESLQNNWMYLEGQILVDYKRLRNGYEESLRQIIKAGIKGGDIKDVNPEILIYSLLATLRSLYIWYPRQKDIEPEKLKTDMIAVMMNGLAR